jgi:hypothetical protein
MLGGSGHRFTFRGAHLFFLRVVGNLDSGSTSWGGRTRQLHRAADRWARPVKRARRAERALEPSDVGPSQACRAVHEVAHEGSICGWRSLARSGHPETWGSPRMTRSNQAVPVAVGDVALPTRSGAETKRLTRSTLGARLGHGP